MTYIIENTNIRSQDSTSVDAFGRWRTSDPLTIFDSKMIHDNLPLLWDDQQTAGSGTASTYNTGQASNTLSVGTSAGTRVRQTKMRFNYQPGKSQYILLTGVLGDKVTGVTKRAGYFDDSNGIYFELLGATLSVVVRSSVTGSLVENRVAQAAWNIDKLDGTGASGISIDTTKTQIMFIDFEWLGVGRVRTGFVINGKSYVAHEFNHANSLNKVYMSTPNLPLRYEISSSGTTAGGSLVQICSSVISEGGVSRNGVLRSVNTGASTITIGTAGVLCALFGIRLRTTHLGATIDFVRSSIIGTTSGDNLIWELILNPTIAGTWTYTDYPNSVLQVAKAVNATNTITNGTLIDSGVVKDGTTGSAELENALRLGTSISGTRDEIVFGVRSLASIVVAGSVTWREIV